MSIFAAPTRKVKKKKIDELLLIFYKPVAGAAVAQIELC